MSQQISLTRSKKATMENSEEVNVQFVWKRRVPEDVDCIEVTTAGCEIGRMFSAFNARLKDGRTIEEAYQCGIKGYDTIQQGKGRPPLDEDISQEELWHDYLDLWVSWAYENPEKMELLRKEAERRGGILTDMYATSHINQAHALTFILNNTEEL